ncbi:thioredoxin-disulfide reductase [bacterium]|nr:thioredoxin-disulfide reductase [bacterium]
MEDLMKSYDVIIVGGGPAGLSAAIYAARGNLSTAVFEKALIGGQINVTYEVENYPGIPEVLSGFELSDRIKQQADKFGPEFIEEEIIKIDFASTNGVKKVYTDDNEYLAKTIIIASGAQPRYLNCPGEQEFIGKGVSYCATCDGALYRNKVVAVIGGGDSAVEEGMFLTKFASKVYVIHRRDELRAVKSIQDRAFKNEKMVFIWDSVVEEVQGENFVKNLVLKNLKTEEKQDLPVDGVFVYVGILPNNELLKKDITLDKSGFVITNEIMETNISGVYAIGDLRNTPLRQVITACSDGAIAAFYAEKFISEME